MLHSHIRIWIHLIWTTKNHQKIFDYEIRQDLASHLIKKAKKENVPFLSLNIQPEHVHGLINLPSDICLAGFMQKIKGESSFWLNKEIKYSSNCSKSKFAWQRGYGAYSVSAFQLDVIKNYIKNQDQHHKQTYFKEEYNKWKIEYGFIDD